MTVTVGSLSMDVGKQRVLLFGVGAIGGFFAFILSRVPEVELTVVARSNHKHLAEEGLIVDSLRHGRHLVKLDHVYDSPAKAQGVYDFIVCTNKAINMEAVAASFKHLTSDNTVFVALQNGVGNEECFQQAYPRNTVLSGVLWVHAIQEGPNVVRHTRPELTELGLHRNNTLSAQLEQDRLNTLASLLTAGQTNVNVESDIQVKRWEKVIWNCAWNPITMLTMVDTKEWLSRPEAVAMTRRLFTEAIDIAIAAGVAVTHELTDTLLKRIAGMPGISASMATDAREGRPLEVDAILGTPVRKAKELGVDAPTLFTLYALTACVNGRLCAA